MKIHITLVAGDFDAEWKPSIAFTSCLVYAIQKTAPLFLETMANAILDRSQKANGRTDNTTPSRATD